MQKKLIALAVAGLMSGAAFAQSNVTIYGVMDLGYLDARTNNQVVNADKTNTGIASGNLATSRIGFRGTEDMGGGLSAVFNLEGTIAADNPGNLAFDRVSTLGLRGSWGTVSMGRMLQLTGAHDSRYTVLYGTAIAPARQASFAAARYGANNNEATRADNNGRISATPEMHHTDRVGNAIAYVSPNMNGFTGAIAYVFVGETKDTDGDGQRRAWNLSGTYEAGPLSVGAAYMNVSNTSSSGNSLDNGSNQWNLGGSYNFGVAQLRLNYANQKSKLQGVGKATRWDIGAVIPVSTAGNVHIAWSDSKRSTDATSVMGERRLGGNAWGLAYTHAMSKRTTAYAAWGNANNKRDARGGFYGFTMESDKAARALAVGLNHTF